MTSAAIVQKLWNYCNVLRADGMSYGDYPSASLRAGSEQLTALTIEASDNLPDPNVTAQEIVEDLEAALEQFREIVGDVGSSRAAERAEE